MYIDASTIITAASVVGGLGVLGGAVAHVVRIVQRDKRQSAAIKAMQEEQTIICYGLRGALQGPDRIRLQRPLQGRPGQAG